MLHTLNRYTNIAISLFNEKFEEWLCYHIWVLNLKTELRWGAKFKQILGIAAIAGVGFTMSIFIDNLAFYGDDLNKLC